MTNYYVFAKDDDIDEVFDELCKLPTSTVSSILVRDNSGIMPARYVRVFTEFLTDVGLVNMINENTDAFSKEIKVVKELQSRVTLV